MLKTLKITSLITMILAACGVVMVVIFGLKGNPEIKAFLESPKITDSIKDKIAAQPKKEDTVPPLVAQAKKFALLIDPPPPPPPPKPKEPVKTPAELARTEPVKPTIPTPKVQTIAKFDLLATVVYETAPEKSLALLKTTAGKEEWFRQGEKVGHLDIQQIKNGSVVFTQGGKNPQEQFVPVKSEPKSLLKGDVKSSASRPAGSSGFTVQLPDAGEDQTSLIEPLQSDQTATDAETEDPGAIRPIRPIDRTSRPRTDVSERIQRVRTAPPPPPLEEQKQSLDETIAGIEAIMKSQDEMLTGEEGQIEAEVWNNLLKELNTEKQRLEAASEEDASAQQAEPEQIQPEQSEPEQIQPEQTEPEQAEPEQVDRNENEPAEASIPSTDQDRQDGNEPAPADPNGP